MGWRGVPETLPLQLGKTGFDDTLVVGARLLASGRCAWGGDREKREEETKRQEKRRNLQCMFDGEEETLTV